VVRRAQKLGVPAPVHRAIHAALVLHAGDLNRGAPS